MQKTNVIETISDTVIASMSAKMDPRAREVLTSLVRHLHDFAREVKLTYPEWLTGIDYLTRAGQMTDEKRNEFILLCDVLGIEALVDAITHDAIGNETESAVLGPFYREGAPVLERGATISKRGELDGPSVLLRGRITDAANKPLANALIEVWECAPNGLYEQQDPEQPDMNLRGQFRTAADGSYEIRCVRPVSYPVPYDGPAGDILQVMGRHPYRPSHVHMMIAAPGFKTLISQLYDKEDKYLDSDSVYSVKGTLLMDFKPAPKELGTQFVVDHNVVMKRAVDQRATPKSVSTSAHA